MMVRTRDGVSVCRELLEVQVGSTWEVGKKVKKRKDHKTSEDLRELRLWPRVQSEEGETRGLGYTLVSK